MAPVFYINSTVKLAKSLAYVLLFRDAHLKRVQGVSWRTIAMLALSLTLNFFNLDKWHGMLPIKEWVLTNLCAWVAAVSVFQRTNVRGLQDCILGTRRLRLPMLMRHLLPMALALAMAAVASIIACKFDVVNFVDWVTKDARGLLCTFQNFLHGTALLPQLMVSRDEQYVAPAAAKFLLIMGIVHVYEFVCDVGVSWIHYKQERLDFHELSFLLGDMFAAIILLDFLYLVLTSKARKDIVMQR
eukprot:CAMPEP_0178423920 /NCGR_PEP_ID=MMETSP0689_2-20121128/27937_1 /TAXON_ID=160604 /ORGANISM="Amphidinium massartii, Strain CS-259" /LENGTH=242 /DNA_ID=CAMNT_0020045529 /DNA_START=87 /DNA_END=812 /DNA_ORIENTATION=+